MPRTYKPSGTKQYKKYSEFTIQAALREYETTNQSLAQISKKYDISKSVLHRYNTRFMKKQGGQTVLSVEEEQYIIEYLNHCSEWGYPLDTYDLRLLVKGYLDRIGVDVKKFKDNLPGPDFVKSFLRRNKEKISLRISQNIKRSRASVAPEVINEYFQELEQTLEGVPLSNIINYDETNLADDPGRRKVLTKRGAKYPERVMNHSKASTSLMMAASADGTLLPCYVVYKAKNLYESWVQQGPKGCRYNCTTSGWFDSKTFEDWVYTIALPYFKEKDGKKVLIGDNLSSHLSLNLIRECKEQNVYFVFLPANSTHITQPLDVAFFRPIKGAWRDILFSWKKNEGRNLPTIPKSVFPTLLKKLLSRIECQASSNILAGFMKSGISPLNKNKVLERLPGQKTRDERNFDKDAMGQTVVSILKEMRYGTGSKPSNRRKKIEVKPGQSVCTETEESEISDREYNQEQSSCMSNESNEADSEENLELSERITPRLRPNNHSQNQMFEAKSARNIDNKAYLLALSTELSKTWLEDSIKSQEKNEAKLNSTSEENVQPRSRIAKLIPEERKRKFEAKSAMIKNTKAIVSTAFPKTTDHKKYSTPKITHQIEKDGRKTKKKDTKYITTVVKNEDVFKKPYDVMINNKPVAINKQKQESEIRMETEDADYKQSLDYVNLNFLDMNDTDIENMPLILYNDNFCVQQELEIPLDNIEEKVEAIVEENEKPTNKIKVTSVKVLETKEKVKVDLKQMKNVHLKETLNVKTKLKKLKDEDILRALTDSNV